MTKDELIRGKELHREIAHRASLLTQLDSESGVEDLRVSINYDLVSEVLTKEQRKLVHTLVACFVRERWENSQREFENLGRTFVYAIRAKHPKAL